MQYCAIYTLWFFLKTFFLNTLAFYSHNLISYSTVMHNILNMSANWLRTQTKLKNFLSVKLHGLREKLILAVCDPLHMNNVFHNMACCLGSSLIGAKNVLANVSIYCATKKQPSWHSSGPCGALAGQVGDGSNQVQLSVTETTGPFQAKAMSYCYS